MKISCCFQLLVETSTIPNDLLNMLHNTFSAYNVVLPVTLSTYQFSVIRCDPNVTMIMLIKHVGVIKCNVQWLILISFMNANIVRACIYKHFMSCTSISSTRIDVEQVKLIPQSVYLIVVFRLILNRCIYFRSNPDLKPMKN